MTAQALRKSRLFMVHRAHALICMVPGGSHLTLISHPGAVTDQILAAAQAACSSSERDHQIVQVHRIASAKLFG